MRIFIFCLIIFLSAGSCMTVSNEQRMMVQQFALKTEKFSTFPEKIWVELSEIREARGVYYANSFTDPATHLQELDAIVKERMKDDRFPGRVRSVFKILDRYADALVRLSSDAPFKTRNLLFARLGIELDTLIGDYNHLVEVQRIPPGLGTVLTQIMDAGTKAYLAGRQRNMLQMYVCQADTLVSVVCDEMVNCLSSDMLGKLIENEASGVGESFNFYFTKRTPPSIESEKGYIALKKRVEVVKILRKQTIQTVNNLRVAHGKIADALKRKKSLKETAIALNNFYREVEHLQSIVNGLSVN